MRNNEGRHIFALIWFHISLTPQCHHLLKSHFVPRSSRQDVVRCGKPFHPAARLAMPDYIQSMIYTTISLRARVTDHSYGMQPSQLPYKIESLYQEVTTHHLSPPFGSQLKNIHSCFIAPTTHVLPLLLCAPAECSRWSASWEVVVGFLISSSPAVACRPELVLTSRPTELNSQIGWPPEVLTCSSFSDSTLLWYRSLLS